MKSIILVGEQPAHGADPNKPLNPYPPSGSGGRLMKILGLTVEVYLGRHDRVNLCRVDWSREEAAMSVDYLLKTRPHNSGMVILGRKAQDAFGFIYPRYEVRHIDAGPNKRLFLLALPHPSGLCRDWNDYKNIERAREAYTVLRNWVGLIADASREGDPSGE